MVIGMYEPKNIRLLINYIEIIEQNLHTKEKFLASLHSQDKVLSSLEELSEASRRLPWGNMETMTRNALHRINNLVFQQLLLPGVIGIDLNKIWQVTAECLPIIKNELSLWANCEEQSDHSKMEKT